MNSGNFFFVELYYSFCLKNNNLFRSSIEKLDTILNKAVDNKNNYMID